MNKLHAGIPIPSFKNILISKVLQKLPLVIITMISITTIVACVNTESGDVSEVVDLLTSSTTEYNTIEIDAETDLSFSITPSRTSSKCPDLDSVLYQIARAEDPENLAEQYRLKIRDGKIQVLLVVEDEELSFLKNYGGELIKQSGDQLQAFVPIQNLCDLANTDEVLTIRMPALATWD